MKGKHIVHTFIPWEHGDKLSASIGNCTHNVYKKVQHSYQQIVAKNSFIKWSKVASNKNKNKEKATNNLNNITSSINILFQN